MSLFLFVLEFFVVFLGGGFCHVVVGLGVFLGGVCVLSVGGLCCTFFRRLACFDCVS